MLRRYPAGSTCGSGDFGNAIFGRAGSDILENPGVCGDLSDDCDDIEAFSVRLLRVTAELTEPVLSLREKMPILAIME